MTLSEVIQAKHAASMGGKIQPPSSQTPTYKPSLSQTMQQRHVNAMTGESVPATTTTTTTVQQAISGQMLNDGTYVSQEAFNSLSPEDQELLKTLGVNAFNAQKQSEYDNFIANSVKLDDGSYISKAEFDKLSPTDQALIKSLGITAYNAQKDAEYQDFLNNNVKVGDQYVSKTYYDSLTPLQKSELERVGIAGFSQPFYSDFLADPQTVEQIAGIAQTANLWRQRGYSEEQIASMLPTLQQQYEEWLNANYYKDGNNWYKINGDAVQYIPPSIDNTTWQQIQQGEIESYNPQYNPQQAIPIGTPITSDQIRQYAIANGITEAQAAGILGAKGYQQVTGITPYINPANIENPESVLNFPQPTVGGVPINSQQISSQQPIKSTNLRFNNSMGGIDAVTGLSTEKIPQLNESVVDIIAKLQNGGELNRYEIYTLLNDPSLFNVGKTGTSDFVNSTNLAKGLGIANLEKPEYYNNLDNPTLTTAGINGKPFDIAFEIPIKSVEQQILEQILVGYNIQFTDEKGNYLGLDAIVAQLNSLYPQLEINKDDLTLIVNEYKSPLYQERTGEFLPQILPVEIAQAIAEYAEGKSLDTANAEAIANALKNNGDKLWAQRVGLDQSELRTSSIFDFLFGHPVKAFSESTPYDLKEVERNGNKYRQIMWKGEDGNYYALEVDSNGRFTGYAIGGTNPVQDTNWYRDNENIDEQIRYAATLPPDKAKDALSLVFIKCTDNSCIGENVELSVASVYLAKNQFPTENYSIKLTNVSESDLTKNNIGIVMDGISNKSNNDIPNSFGAPVKLGTWSQEHEGWILANADGLDRITKLNDDKYYVIVFDQDG